MFGIFSIFSLEGPFGSILGLISWGSGTVESGFYIGDGRGREASFG